MFPADSFSGARQRQENVMKGLCVLISAAALLTASSANAQNAGGTVGGAAGGAAVGAVVGGPVGAVVGGAVGGIVGSTLPSEPSVVYRGPVVVGQTLPPSITYYHVPDYDAYDYAVLNGRRVIVERRTHRVLRVIE
jgi:hypothetical protein